MRYATFALTFSPDLLDEVEAALVVGGIEHWAVPLELEPEEEPHPEVAAHAVGRIEVHAPEAEADETARVLSVALASLPVEWDRTLVDEEDWAEGWKKHWKVQRLGARIVVKPTWEAYEARPEDIVLDLDPRQAFGTGTHATTRLALALLELRLCPGEVVYDVGCGTGILALAALKLGASRAFAVDHDQVAVATCLENLERNGEVHRAEVFRADQPPARSAEVVVANILADVLIGMAPALAATTGRVLILSGIIRRRVADVCKAFEAQGMVITETLVEEDWEALVMEWPAVRGS
ncbi:MAG: 50S ribosomal protein L11 methyltransferase [Candidatus Sericytochromatia bacterium]|nr:50S ribosomal protein L11 methyltransferase [Candidatus Sericytochromatia bacterium]